VTELGCASPADRARPGKNGILKTGFGIRKNGVRKTGFGLQADRARPGKNWIISVCALQLQLQSYKRVYVCRDLFLFVAKMAIICRKMWKKWAIL